MTASKTLAARRPRPRRQVSRTETAILDAAEELFATQGFAATSIKQIGQRAQVNTALLYYYFGDKTGVYRAVLGRLMDLLRQSASPSVRLARTAEEAIRALLRGQAELMTRHPRAAALLLREMIDHEAAHAVPLIHKLASDLFRPVTKAIADGQRVGAVRAGLDPAYVTISTIAQLVYFMLAQPLIRQLLGSNGRLGKAADIRRFAQHAEQFALAALAPTDLRASRAT